MYLFKCIYAFVTHTNFSTIYDSLCEQWVVIPRTSWSHFLPLKLKSKKISRGTREVKVESECRLYLVCSISRIPKMPHSVFIQCCYAWIVRYLYLLAQQGEINLKVSAWTWMSGCGSTAWMCHYVCVYAHIFTCLFVYKTWLLRTSFSRFCINVKILRLQIRTE